MTVQAVPRGRLRRRSGTLVPVLALLIVLVAAAATFVSYVLWPTWPRVTIALDAPAIPVTIAGVLLNVPPAAIRAAVQRHPGAHERIDLVFLWPSLAPPEAGDQAAVTPAATSDEDDTVATPLVKERVFVTIAGLGAVLPPAARLRSIYPRYIETQATAGPDGLAVVPFRAGTPYEGEDLVYLAEQPEQFFVRCSRAARLVPGICTHERLLDGAEITARFPREWLQDWRNVAAGFDRLVTQLHADNR
jgi:hypothetical protein